MPDVVKTWCPVHGVGTPVNVLDDNRCSVVMSRVGPVCRCVATGPGADAACEALGRAEKAEAELSCARLVCTVTASAISNMGADDSLPNLHTVRGAIEAWQRAYELAEIEGAK